MMKKNKNPKINKIMNFYKIYIFQMIWLFTGALGNSVFADSNSSDYGTRMKERLPAVIKAKEKGLVGEGTDGLLHIRKDATADIKKMVTGENNDRKQLFQTMASKTGGTSKEVATKFSKALVKKSKKGHWFRKSSGKWVQRK
jgi:uncharacterized protein YdbL (DUF1318 family)|tara:strand:+ start:561 stop:986 length:426 start_codon:yes stop_codon:yes gene_type:complete